MDKAQISEEQERDFKIAFDLFDFDGSGLITHEKLAKVMERLGQGLTTQDLTDMIKEVDSDGNGEISFDEFAILMLKNVEKHDTQEEYRELFNIFDINHKNQIGRQELREILEKIDIIVSAEEIEDIMHEAALENPEYFTYEEFVRMMSGNMEE